MSEKITSDVRSALVPATGLNIKNSIGYEGRDILFNFGSARSALFYSVLFVPKFTVYEGFVFLDDGVHSIPSDLEKAKQGSSNSAEGWVENFNWRDLSHVFARHDLDDVGYSELAELVACCWTAHLKMRFPTRTFIVEVLSPKITGDGVGVGFTEQATV